MARNNNTAGYEPPVVELTIGKNNTLLILILLSLSLVLGLVTHTSSYLKAMLFAGMYFTWIIYFLGVIRLVVPQWYQGLDRPKGWIVKSLLILLVFSVLCILSIMAQITF